jgi:hypothetical protein
MLLPSRSSTCGATRASPRRCEGSALVNPSRWMESRSLYLLNTPLCLLPRIPRRKLSSERQERRSGCSMARASATMPPTSTQLDTTPLSGCSTGITRSGSQLPRSPLFFSGAHAAGLCTQLHLADCGEVDMSCNAGAQELLRLKHTACWIEHTAASCGHAAEIGAP